jgi:hypothetical protein
MAAQHGIFREASEIGPHSLLSFRDASTGADPDDEESRNRVAASRRVAIEQADQANSRREIAMQQAITHLVIRNPFGTMDVPSPDDSDVTDYAATATLSGDATDGNAAAWASIATMSDPIEGLWASRWNGGADPTIAGDTVEKWKQGRAEVQVKGERIYLRFDWDNGRRHGLIDAARDGADRLVGKYINLTTPAITRPWIGLVVDASRIDGCFPNGRLDFRR